GVNLGCLQAIGVVAELGLMPHAIDLGPELTIGGIGIGRGVRRWGTAGDVAGGHDLRGHLTVGVVDRGGHAAHRVGYRVLVPVAVVAVSGGFVVGIGN